FINDFIAILNVQPPDRRLKYIKQIQQNNIRPKRRSKLRIRNIQNERLGRYHRFSHDHPALTRHNRLFQILTRHIQKIRCTAIQYSLHIIQAPFSSLVTSELLLYPYPSLSRFENKNHWTRKTASRANSPPAQTPTGQTRLFS